MLCQQRTNIFAIELRKLRARLCEFPKATQANISPRVLGSFLQRPDVVVRRDSTRESAVDTPYDPLQNVAVVDAFNVLAVLGILHSKRNEIETEVAVTPVPCSSPPRSLLFESGEPFRDPAA